jgi:predicted transcriptional regulator
VHEWHPALTVTGGGMTPLMVARPVIPVCYHSGMAMTLRLTDEDEQALTLLAEAQGISKQEATVRAIRDAAARRVHEDRVRELSAQARDRYAEVLERLGR